ncbi:hypothetical protein TUSST3_30370 [Streptomyces sp. TUS-ST3]|nr:hypothetical protein TUSST3_30370 [Streptomyces sp. TUS-ST3]
MRDGARTGTFDELHTQPGPVTKHNGADTRLRHLDSLLRLGEPEGIAIPSFLSGEVGDGEADVMETSSCHGNSYG